MDHTWSLQGTRNTLLTTRPFCFFLSRFCHQTRARWNLLKLTFAIPLFTTLERSVRLLKVTIEEWMLQNNPTTPPYCNRTFCHPSLPPLTATFFGRKFISIFATLLCHPWPPPLIAMLLWSRFPPPLAANLYNLQRFIHLKRYNDFNLFKLLHCNPVCEADMDDPCQTLARPQQRAVLHIKWTYPTADCQSFFYMFFSTSSFHRTVSWVAWYAYQRTATLFTRVVYWSEHLHW